MSKEAQKWKDFWDRNINIKKKQEKIKKKKNKRKNGKIRKHKKIKHYI